MATRPFWQREDIKLKLLTTCVHLLMLFYAFSVTMIAPLLPVLIEQYNLSLGQGGLFMTFLSIGGILAILAGGMVADRLRKSLLVGGSFLVYSCCLLFMDLVPSFKALLGMFFILGASTRLLDTTINAFISDLHRDNRGFQINLLHTFFGVGALLGPLYSRVLLTHGVLWGNTFRILGAICLFIMLLYIVSLKAYPESVLKIRSSAAKGRLGFIFSREIILLCIIMILYKGHQSGINNWLPMYLQDTLKLDPFFSSLALSIFWVGLILARLICPRLMCLIDSKYLILWGNLFGGIILLGGFIINIPLVLMLSVGITGFLTGATMPLLIVLGCGWYPENSGTVSSMIYLSSTFSNMFFPWAIGVVGEATSFKGGMLITGVPLIMILIFILPLLKKDKSEKRMEFKG